MLGRSVNLTTLFLGRLKPPLLLTGTQVHILFLPVSNCQLSRISRRRNESTWLDWVSNREPLALESDTLLTVLRGPALANYYMYPKVLKYSDI